MTAGTLFRQVSTFSALGCLILALSACGRGSAHLPPPAPSVTVARVEQKEIVEWDEFTGRTEHVEAVDVRIDVISVEKLSRQAHHLRFPGARGAGEED